MVGSRRPDGAELGGGRTGLRPAFVPADRRRGRDQPPDRCAAAELDLGRHRLPDVRQSTLAADLDVGARPRGQHRLFAHRGRQRAGPSHVRRHGRPAPNSLDLLATYSSAERDRQRIGSEQRAHERLGRVDGGRRVADRVPADPALVDGRDVWRAGSPTSRRPASSGRAEAGRVSSSSTAGTSRTPASRRSSTWPRGGWSRSASVTNWSSGRRARSSSSSRSWSTSTTAPASDLAAPTYENTSEFLVPPLTILRSFDGQADTAALLQQAASLVDADRLWDPEAVAAVWRPDLTPELAKWRPRPVIVVHQPTVPGGDRPAGLDAVRSEHRHDGSVAGPAGRAATAPDPAICSAGAATDRWPTPTGCSPAEPGGVRDHLPACSAGPAVLACRGSRCRKAARLAVDSPRERRHTHSRRMLSAKPSSRITLKESSATSATDPASDRSPAPSTAASASLPLR